MSDGSKCRHLKGDELCFTGRASGSHEVREQEEYNRKSNFCNTTERTLEGIEAINMMRKGQVKRLAGSDAMGQAAFVASLFGIAA